ncbi:MAG: FmdB family zinc ribbon protein [Phycisphaerae bacterium]
MPIYEFECKDCGKTFDHLAPSMQSTNQKALCPQCQSKNTIRKVSVFAVANAQPSGAAMPGGEGGGGCCCGAGGCGSHN